MRILIGVGAWLLGVAAATAGSLLAVSLLGQGIADSPGQQLTAAAVNQALAREASEANEANEANEATPTPLAPAPSATPSALPPSALAPSASTRTAAARPPARHPQEIQAPPLSATQQPTSSTAQAANGTVLTSPGGTVLAECGSAGSYLVSWSPTQGYDAGNVLRGPAATAQVSFDSDANSVTMLVSCSTGVPIATSTVRDHSSGGAE
jgi:hypothetical protein